MSLRKERIREEVKTLRPDLDRVHDIYEKAEAEKRALTAAEQATCAPIIARGKELSQALREVRADDDIRAAAKALAAEIGDPIGSGNQRAVAESAKGRRLTFKGMGAKVATMALGEDGTKALAPSGAEVVGQEFEADPIALGRAATGLLDVLPVKTHGSPEFAYMMQNTRTNNAAQVPAGAVKPTSLLGLEKVDKSLAVVAHLSEGVPRYWLLDNEMLTEFVDNELQFGLGLAVEAKVIADINATSGIQVQAFSTSALQTIRKCLTKLEVFGLEPGAIVLNPVDFEGLELALTSINAIEHLSLPYDAATRRLFGVPIATTISEAAGTSHVLAKDAVVLDTDTIGVGVQWSENSNSDDFSRNLIRARCEGRFATSVKSLLGVVIADLAP